MLVSIIIPVYNVCPYISESLNSVLHQTYEDLEIIIIDDGSSDGSGEICDEYAARDARIRVIHQNNQGLSAARNIGLDIMCGDAVAFLDSDDAYRNDFIELMVDTMIREQTGIVVCKCSVHHATEQLIQTAEDKIYPDMERGIYDRNGALQALIERKINFAVWNKLYARDLWNNIRFPEGRVYEDIDTIIHVISKSRNVYVVDQPMYLHRIHADSITNTFTQKNIGDWLIARNNLESFIKDNIPSVFSNEQLIHSQQSRLRQMVCCYMRLSVCREKIVAEFNENMRKLTIELGSEIGIGNCGWKILLCYWMLQYCPWLLKGISTLYYNAFHLPVLLGSPWCHTLVSVLTSRIINPQTESQCHFQQKSQ